MGNMNQIRKTKKNERDLKKKIENSINKRKKEKKKMYENLVDNEEEFEKIKQDLDERYLKSLEDQSKEIDEDLEISIEAYKRVLELQKYKKIDEMNYKYYPEIYDLDFSKKILEKKEFNKYQLNTKNINDEKELNEESLKLCN